MDAMAHPWLSAGNLDKTWQKTENSSGADTLFLLHPAHGGDKFLTYSFNK